MVHNKMELKVHQVKPILEPMVHDEKARKDFSLRLALACKNAGLDNRGKGADIAKALNVTPKAVSKWMNAESMPRHGKMQQLAILLGVDIAWLQFGEPGEDNTVIRYPDFSNRLNSLMAIKGVDVNTLSTIGDITYEMARRYTLGIAKPRDEKMKKIAAGLGTTAAFLDYGEGEKEIINPDVEKLVQLDAHASAGHGYINRDFPEIIRSIEIPKERVYELFGRKSLNGVSIINADGDSMMPTLNPRDLLFIDSTVDHFTGDGIYVFSFESATFIKRLQRIKGSKLAVISDNNKYLPFYIEEHEMEQFYVFGKLIKQLPLNFKDYA